MVRAGAMRHQVKLQARATTQDAAGEPTLTWSDVATKRAAVERAPGSEVWSSAQRSGRVPTVFRLRYPRDLASPVTPAMRLVFDGRVYNILSAVDQAGLKEELVITAEENVGEVP